MIPQEELEIAGKVEEEEEEPTGVSEGSTIVWGYWVFVCLVHFIVCLIMGYSYGLDL